MENNNKPHRQEGSATHSGWHEFYSLFSKYRDESLKMGQVVLGTNKERAVSFLRQYVSSLYSMAQQIFNFYDIKLEEEITEDWLKLLRKVDDVTYLFSDTDFRNQMKNEGRDFIDEGLKKELILFFNRLDRLASKAGLLVGKENKDLNDPKRGLLGY